MQRVRLAARGALLLCVALSLPACTTVGSKPAPLPAIKPQLEVVTQRTYAPIPAELTAKPVLPPAPIGIPSPDCNPFCYSNKQLADMLANALSALNEVFSHLDRIAYLSGKAVQTNPQQPPKETRP